VNLRFLPEPLFLSKNLALGLLATQLVLLAAYFTLRERRNGGIVGVFARSLQGPVAELAAAKDGNLAPAWIVSGMFVSNFIGIVCARSLHYQVRQLNTFAVPYSS